MAREKFKIPVGFGTAIPFCLDERLITENMWADCGVGVTFCAINPDGDLRICNQSGIVYGNVLKKSLEKIWNKKEIDEFRDLRWVREPCKNCPFLSICTCGCKVDLSFCEKYCIDYAIRENRENLVPLKRLKELVKVFKKNESEKIKVDIPFYYRNFRPNKYTKLNFWHKEKYLVTRYQTIYLDKISVEIIKKILKGISSEKQLINEFKKIVELQEIRRVISILLKVEAIELI